MIKQWLTQSSAVVLAFCVDLFLRSQQVNEPNEQEDRTWWGATQVIVENNENLNKNVCVKMGGIRSVGRSAFVYSNVVNRQMPSFWELF